MAVDFGDGMPKRYRSMAEAQCYPSNREEYSSEPEGYVGLQLSLELESFPEVAFRIGLALAEAEEGLSGVEAHAFAREFRDRQIRAYRDNLEIMEALDKKKPV